MNSILKNINNLELNYDIKDGDYFEYELNPVYKENSTIMQVNGTYDIQVKDYMTRKSNSNFDFMLQWNSNIPMPGVIARGKVLDETRGMFRMKVKTPDNKSWEGWIVKSAILKWEEVK